MEEFSKGLMKLDSGDEESSSILVYGDSNAGKTRLAGTLPPETGWLVCEPGFKAAARYRQREGLPPHKFARRIGNSAEAWAAVEWLNERERYRKLKWLVVDGLSTMQDRFRLAYAAEAFDLNPAKRAHRNLPDRPDYFNTQNFLKNWIPQLVDMPVNLLITAHAYRTDLTEDAELLVFPGVQGKVTETSNAISGLMDVTGYLEARNVKSRNSDAVRVNRRLWLSSPSGRARKDGQDVRYIVGDKYDCLGKYIDMPTMPGIMAMINGEET
jgi:AAA domain